MHPAPSSSRIGSALPGHGMPLPSPTLADLVLAACLLAGSLAAQATLRVPSQYPTIQSAIAAAAPRDTVLVDPGTYKETIDFLGKAILVRSSGGPEATILDGERVARCALFTRGEGRDSRLEGFALVRGFAREGGAVWIDGAAPTLRRCIFTDNRAGNGGRGGAVGIQRGGALVEECRFERNATQFGSGGALYANEATLVEVRHCAFVRNGDLEAGGAVFVSGGEARVIGSTFSGNRGAVGGALLLATTRAALADLVLSENLAEESAGLHVATGVTEIDRVQVLRNSTNYSFKDIGGPAGAFLGGTRVRVRSSVFSLNTVSAFAPGTAGGVEIAADDAQLTHVTITGNAGFHVGGLLARPTTRIVNSILWANTARLPGAPGQLTGVAEVSHCCVQGGHPGSNNLASDPLLEPTPGYFHIAYPSPCRNAGLAETGAGDTDFEGDPRAAEDRPDIGADEWHPHLYVRGPVAGSASLDLACIGHPGGMFFVLFSGDPELRQSGALWPGFAGGFALKEPFLAVPVSLFSFQGQAALGVQIPAGLPPGTVAPVQAIAGRYLTNPLILRL